MVRTILVCGACLLSCAASTFAQFPLSQPFCNAGVHPDAFLDWSKLPASPNTTSFTTTIPVAGAPGLTATVAFTNVSLPFGPLYSVTGNTLLEVNGNDGVVTITFNQEIQGIRLLAETYGRFGHSFDMQAKNATGVLIPATFNSSSAGSDPTPGVATSTPLEIEEDSPQIKSVTFTFQSNDGEYAYFSLDNVRIQLGSADRKRLVNRSS